MLVHGRDMSELKLYKLLDPGRNNDPHDLCFTVLNTVWRQWRPPWDLLQCWLARVVLTDDQPVWQEEVQWRADRVIFASVVRVDHWLNQQDSAVEIMTNLFDWHPDCLRYCSLLTDRLMAAAVEAMPSSLRYFHNVASERVILLALERDPVLLLLFSEDRITPKMFAISRVANAQQDDAEDLGLSDDSLE